MKIKHYKTDSEREREPERRCRFEMLSKLLDADVAEHPGLKPRLLHIEDKWFHGLVWAVAIVVWE